MKIIILNKQDIDTYLIHIVSSQISRSFSSTKLYYILSELFCPPLLIWK